MGTIYSNIYTDTCEHIYFFPFQPDFFLSSISPLSRRGTFPLFAGGTEGVRGTVVPRHTPEPHAPAFAWEPARIIKLPRKLLISSKCEAESFHLVLVAAALLPSSQSSPPRLIYFFSPQLRFCAVSPEIPWSPRQGWGRHRARAPAPGRDRGAFSWRGGVRGGGSREEGRALTF